jgi:hypothetical protein
MADESYVVRGVAGPDEQLPPLKINERKRRKAPPTMPPPPFLMAMWGNRGAGKTTNLIKLIRWYDLYDAFDRYVVFTPSTEDPKWQAMAKEKLKGKLELVSDYSEAQLGRIKREQTDAITQFDRHELAIQAYKKYCKRNQQPERLSEAENLLLHEYNFADPEATKKFERGVPSALVAFDDQVGNNLVYKHNCQNEVGRTSLRHRHANMSFVYMCQVYRNGLPAGLRFNVNVCMFFANKSEAEKYRVAEEASAFCSPDEFVTMWTYATECDPMAHGFFMVYFDPAKPEWRFRRNFNQLIIPSGRTTEEEDKNEEEEQQQQPPDPKRKKKNDQTGEQKEQRAKLVV